MVAGNGHGGSFGSQIDKLLDTLPSDERRKWEAALLTLTSRDNLAAEVFQGLQTSLDDMRLSVKYLVFDLEATRRENEELRRLLDESN